MKTVEVRIFAGSYGKNYPIISVSAWWAGRDLNPQPDRYERPALTIELPAQRTRWVGSALAARAAPRNALLGRRGRVVLFFPAEGLCSAAMNSRTFVLESNRAGAADARARAFRAARRHSLRVFALRRVLEIGVAGGLAALAVFPLYRNFGRALRDVSFDGIGIEGGRITMDKPRLSGSRPGGGGYNITAAKAMQDARRPGDIDLALIGGDISTPDHDVSRLSAQTGHYDGATETLDLSGDVRLKNARYEIFLRSVHIAFKKGEYVSNEAVTVRIQPDAVISADAFSARDNGAEVRFEGHVRTQINANSAARGETP